MHDKILTLTVTEEDGEARLDRFLRRRFPHLTQGQLERLLRTGQIRLDGARARAADRVVPGQVLRVPPLPKADRPAPTGSSNVSARDRELIRSMVLYEDDHVIALNKPAGLAVQGGTGTLRHIDGMLDALQEGEHRPRLVHRLDRDTSGVLVLARTPAAAAQLGALFRGRELEKIYWAVVLGVPHPMDGQIRGWMIKDEGPGGDREKMRSGLQKEPGSVFAVTDYVVLDHASDKAAWVALKPHTGRTHQLRFHMSLIGTAIVGDRKYTCNREPLGGIERALHLHARALRLPRVGKPPLTIEAPPPVHFKETFSQLGLELRGQKDSFKPFSQPSRWKK
jgi:23S rRNA pseudouridine955/2504/2580 synthase